MPLFKYVAKKSPTEVVEDTFEAENREAVLHHLSGLGYIPVKIVETDSSGKALKLPKIGSLTRGVPTKHVQAFIRQFASLTRSQVSVARALRILKEQAEHKSFRSILEKVSTKIESEGQSLSVALSEFPHVFTPEIVSLIQAGEVGGVLDKVLDRLAQKMEREEQIRSKLQAALVYPLFVALMGVVTVVVLITFVMPRILKVITNFGGDLPVPTRLLMGLTNMMTHWVFWFFAMIIAGLGWYVWKFVLSKNRLIMDRLVIEIPVVGELIKQIELARFCRSLGLLLDHGVLILPAIETAIRVVQNQYFIKQLEGIPVTVKEGNPMSQGMQGLSLATPFLINTITIGEEGGRLGEGLSEAAQYYELEAEKGVQVVASLLEPLIILSIGIFIGFIVMAVLLPVFDISGVVR